MRTGGGKPKKQRRTVEPEAYDHGWRLFISLPVPPEVRELMRGVVSYVDGENWPIRWANPNLAHVTLAFLGDTEPERAELLRAALPKLVASRQQFMLQTGQAGVFPSAAEPRILWLGLAGQIKQLADLHDDVNRMLRSLDFPVEQKPLRPHLTLGRARDELPVDFPSMITQKFLDPRLQERLGRSSVRFPVAELSLMRSYLGKGGAKHIPVITSQFGGTAQEE